MDVRAIHTPPLTIGAPVQHQRPAGAPPTESTPVRAQQPATTPRHPVLTAEEQRYFEGLFPDAAQDLQGHLAYTGAGARSQTQSGTIVDRRI